MYLTDFSFTINLNTAALMVLCFPYAFHYSEEFPNIFTIRLYKTEKN